MSMKFYYACLMVISFLTAPVFAQDQSQGEGNHQPPSTADIVAKLNLSTNQTPIVTTILDKYKSQIGALRQQVEDGTMERNEMRAQMKDLWASEKQELSQILSADQLSQWEQIQRAGHKHGNGGGGNGGSWGHGDDSSENGSGSGSSGSGE